MIYPASLLMFYQMFDNFSGRGRFPDCALSDMVRLLF